MSSPVDNAELPKLPENQKSFAGIPEAVFVVSSIQMHDLNRLHNLKTITHYTFITTNEKLNLNAF